MSAIHSNLGKSRFESLASALQKIEQLKNENQYLRGLLQVNAMVRPDLKLTKAEKQIILFMARAAPMTVTRESLHGSLYGGHDPITDEKIVNVFICNIRKKIKPLGLVIHIDWGSGWRLDVETAKALIVEAPNQ